MAAVASLLSGQAIATVAISYTTPHLVSETTGGQISEADVKTEWIDWAREQIDRQTGMCFQSQDFSEELDGQDLSVVFTKCFPLLEITDLFIDGNPVSPSDYVVNKRTGSITLRDLVFPMGLRNVEVRGIHGHRIVPPLIQKIATLIVAKTALSAKCGVLVDSESIGGFNQSRSLKKINDELDRAWAAWGRRFPIHFV